MGETKNLQNRDKFMDEKKKRDRKEYQKQYSKDHKYHPSKCKKPTHVIENQFHKDGRCRKCSALSCKRWRNKNPEYRSIYRAEEYEKNIEKYKNRRLIARWGITLEKYNSLLLYQDGKCAICKRPESSIDNRSKRIKQLAVDHCHVKEENGIIKIRGLLCLKCNRGLGLFEDSIEFITNAANYLRKNK